MFKKTVLLIKELIFFKVLAFYTLFFFLPQICPILGVAAILSLFLNHEDCKVLPELHI